MTRKKQSRGRSATEFHTVKKLDNTLWLVRHMEPVKMRNLYRTVALGTFIAAFFLVAISTSTFSALI